MSKRRRCARSTSWSTPATAVPAWLIDALEPHLRAVPQGASPADGSFPTASQPAAAAKQGRHRRAVVEHGADFGVSGTAISTAVSCSTRTQFIEGYYIVGLLAK